MWVTGDGCWGRVGQLRVGGLGPGLRGSALRAGPQPALQLRGLASLFAGMRATTLAPATAGGRPAPLPRAGVARRHACSPLPLAHPTPARAPPQSTTATRSTASPAADDAAAAVARPARLIQHKAEAFIFYRFLSIVYDAIVNPGHWTVDMRDAALAPAKLESPDLKVRPGCCMVRRRTADTSATPAQPV